MIPTGADISVYSDVDPDVLYESGGQSLTFFYTGKMIARPFPTNHEDMLNDPKVFYEVFPDFEGVLPPRMIKLFLYYEDERRRHPDLDSILTSAGMDPARVKATNGCRGKALKFGDALIGRVGIYQNDLILALWNKKHENFDYALEDAAFVKPIASKWGRYLKEMIVVGEDNDPAYWSELGGTVNDDTDADDSGLGDTPKASASGDTVKGSEDSKKKYTIKGREYSLDELGYMRGRMHSAPRMSGEWKSYFNVLCSDDMLKYPELQGYRPSACYTGQKSPSSSERWLDSTRKLYDKEREEGKEPSTGLLYPAWRAHSESTGRSPTFREFLIMDGSL